MSVCRTQACTTQVLDSMAHAHASSISPVRRKASRRVRHAFYRPDALAVLEALGLASLCVREGQSKSAAGQQRPEGAVSAVQADVSRRTKGR